jgi:hypothetical protein|tara:strand:+ start:158 stop:568 length:411 start_codon:yes stop_codon:yes gene_type:complete
MAKTASPRGRFPATISGLILPPIVWALFFVVIYALQGVACVGAEVGSAPEKASLLSLVLFAVALATIGIITTLGVWSFRSWRNAGRSPDIQDDDDEPTSLPGFLSLGCALSAGLFLVATLWIGLPILLMSPCKGLL